jgi:hypothetical protein
MHAFAPHIESMEAAVWIGVFAVLMFFIIRFIVKASKKKRK